MDHLRLLCVLSLMHPFSMETNYNNFEAVFGEIDIMHYFTHQDFNPGNTLGLAWVGTAW
jgi:hypothetical protein